MGNFLYCKSKQGAVLVLTLTILLVLGILGGSFYGMVAAEKREVIRRHAKNQAELSAYSALEFALQQMRNSRIPWRSTHLKHQAMITDVYFDLASAQHGAFAQLTAKGHSSVGSFEMSKELKALSGFGIKALPALTLLDPNASVSLAGKAVVEGSVALQRGRIERSTHYKMPAGSTARFTGKLLGENWPIWKSIAIYPEQTGAWLENKLNQSNKYCNWDALDTLRGDAYCKKAILRGDVHCDNCRIYADTITVSGNVSLEKALLVAYHMRLEGKGQVDGQFLVRDSLEINLESPQQGNAVFLSNGRKTGPAEYSGNLAMHRYQGKALVLFMGENWDASLLGIPVTINEKVSLQGLILVHGPLNMKGTITGSVVAWNLIFEEGGTLWQGYLKDAFLKQDTSSIYLIPDSWFLGGKAMYEVP